MKKITLFFILLLILSSCSHKKQIIYLEDINKNNINKFIYSDEEKIEIGDVLKIDVNTPISEISNPYNNSELSQNIDILLLEGYKVEKDSLIN